MFRLWSGFVFVFLAVVLPWASVRRMKMLAQRAPGAMPAQRWLYPRIVFAQWFLALAVVFGLWRFGVPLRALGLVAPRLVPLAWTAAALVVAWAVWERRL